VAQLVCPICGSGSFEDYRNVPKTRCRSCKSNERTRAVKLFLDKYVGLRFGHRVLHFAPEPQLSKHIAGIIGDAYEAVDIDPARYAAKSDFTIRRLDLCTEAPTLADNRYDMVLHNHVMEHVPCNFTLVLQHLHRAIKPGGVHLFSVPIFSGYFSEDLNPTLTDDERQTRFGQGDHMRRFGRADFGFTLGAIFGLEPTYSLADFFTHEELRKANIRESQWACSGSSIFYVRK
jgi:SAM-dependent methyltransferase